MLDRRRRAQAHRGGDRGRRPLVRRLRQGAARQGGAARRSALGHRLDRPARHRAQLQPDDGVRHAADGRLGLSLFRVPAEGRRRRAACRSTSTPACCRSAFPWRSASSAMPPRRCAPCCRDCEPKSRRRLAQEHRRQRREMVEDAGGSRAGSRPHPVNPQRVAWELSPRLPDRAIITSDSGSCANWFARDLKMRRGMTASLSGGLASMGAAVPYAIAAKYAHPGSPGDRTRRRWRHADEQHGRADHGREVLARLARSALDRLRLQQRGPQPGDLGAADHQRRSEIRGVAAHSERVLFALRRADRPRAASTSTARDCSARPGSRRWRARCRWCWR